MLGVSCLNKLDAATKGTQRFSNPQALSSTLAAFGMLQPQAFGLLNRLVPLVLVSNYYLTAAWLSVTHSKSPEVMDFYEGLSIIAQSGPHQPGPSSH